MKVYEKVLAMMVLTALFVGCGNRKTSSGETSKLGLVKNSDAPASSTSANTSANKPGSEDAVSSYKNFSDEIPASLDDADLQAKEGSLDKNQQQQQQHNELTTTKSAETTALPQSNRQTSHHPSHHPSHHKKAKEEKTKEEKVGTANVAAVSPVAVASSEKQEAVSESSLQVAARVEVARENDEVEEASVSPLQLQIESGRIDSSLNSILKAQGGHVFCAGDTIKTATLSFMEAPLVVGFSLGESETWQSVEVKNQKLHVSFSRKLDGDLMKYQPTQAQDVEVDFLRDRKLKDLERIAISMKFMATVKTFDPVAFRDSDLLDAIKTSLQQGVMLFVNSSLFAPQEFFNVADMSVLSPTHILKKREEVVVFGEVKLITPPVNSLMVWPYEGRYSELCERSEELPLVTND